MNALRPAVDARALTIIHRVGSDHDTRSHFEAQDSMEHGGQAGGGWIGRFLRFHEHASAGALSVVALCLEVPEPLRGAPSATALQSINDFRFSGNYDFVASLRSLYRKQNDFFVTRANDTFHALDRLRELHAKDYTPANGAEYSGDRFCTEMRMATQLIKARLGVEAITVDLGGLDSHISQGPAIIPNIGRLANGLAAFRRDLGVEMLKTTVVVMSEFGRRVKENSVLGTDHGRGGLMFIMGGDGEEGKTIADWPGLTEENLVGPGDLPVMTDYRDVLFPIL